MMNLKRIVQPVGFFGIGAVIATFFVVVNLFTSWTYGLYWFWFSTAIILLCLEAGSQITGYRPFAAKPLSEAPSPESARADRPVVWLNLLCFAMPPLGLFLWLTLDNRLPRRARSAARSGVRGALIALIVLGVWNMSNAVSIACLAIERASLQPLSAAKVEKRIAHKKWLRQQARQPVTPRPSAR